MIPGVDASAVGTTYVNILTKVLTLSDAAQTNENIYITVTLDNEVDVCVTKETSCGKMDADARYAWSRPLTFEIPSESVDMTGVHVSVRTQRSKKEHATGTWPWELSHTIIDQKSRWIPLQTTSGELFGKLKMSVGMQNRDVMKSDSKKKNIRRHDSSAYSHVEDDEVPLTPSDAALDALNTDCDMKDTSISQTRPRLHSGREVELVDVLLKRSRWRKRWNKRTFALKGNVLQHFSSSPESSPRSDSNTSKKTTDFLYLFQRSKSNLLGSLLLTSGHSVHPIDHPISGAKHAPPQGWFEFEIRPAGSSSGGEVIFLAAPSRETRTDWIDALKNAIRGGRDVLSAHDRSIGTLRIEVGEAQVPRRRLLLGGHSFVAQVKLEDVSQIVPTNAGKESTLRIPFTDPTADVVVQLRHSSTTDHSVVGVVIVPLSMFTCQHMDFTSWFVRHRSKPRVVSGWFRILPHRQAWSARKHLPAVQGKLGSGLTRPSRHAWVWLELEMTTNDNNTHSYLTCSYLTQNIHARSRWPEVSSKYSSATKYRMKERIALFRKRPRRWLLHIRDLRTWNRPIYSCIFLAVVWFILIRARGAHVPLVIALVFFFLSFLSIFPHDDEGERTVTLWNDELENHDRTLWGKLWHIAYILGRLQYATGHVLDVVEKIENCFTWEDPHVTMIALVLLFFVASIAGALVELLLQMYAILPIRVLSACAVTYTFLPRDILKRRRGDTVKRSSRRELRRTDKMCTQDRKTGEWRRRLFVLYDDHVSYWDSCGRRRSPKYSMRLDDIVRIVRLTNDDSMCRFEIEASLSSAEGHDVKWVMGIEDTKSCDEWIEWIRGQQVRVKKRKISSEENGLSTRSTQEEITSASTSVVDSTARDTDTTRSLLGTMGLIISRFWARIPHHDEIVHRKIARAQLYNNPRDRDRKNLVGGLDSGSDSESGDE